MAIITKIMTKIYISGANMNTNPMQFCVWLQGALEMTDAKELNEEQTQKVKDKLNSVFEHVIDPQRDSETSADREDLQAAHDGRPYRHHGRDRHVPRMC